MTYPQIDPVAFSVGPISVHWYGLSYLFAFLACWGLLAWRIKYSKYPRDFTLDQLSDIVFYSALGIIIGGRLGYMLFYNFSAWLEDPLLGFKIWTGGMSFHGGLIGAFVALWLYGRKINKSVIAITDFILPAVPIGLASGRIGNFINGELWGRVTDAPFAMVFPNAGPLPRHPSQLYEFTLEGLLLFLILWLYSIKPKPRYAVTGLFLIGYGIARFIVEFFRQPDAHIGFVAFGWLTKGQLLSAPMIILGLIMFIMAYKRGNQLCNNT